MSERSIVIAFGAISPLGRGVDALPVAALGEPARIAIRHDAELRAFGLERCAAARLRREGADELDPLGLAMGDCLAELDRGLPGWRSLRVGLVLGTSSGAMDRAEPAYDALAAGKDPTLMLEAARALAYGEPFLRARAALGLPLAREAHLLAACASSTVTLGLAHTWLHTGRCDVVLAGGYDVLTRFVAAGFAALGAVTMTLPRPFTAGRDGLGLGEGAGVVAVVRASALPPGASVHAVVAGFGVSCDAVHLTAPDRDGKGLASALSAALASGGLEAAQVGDLGAHATSTPYNDAAESRAFAAVLGPRAATVPVHAPKSTVGHLLGAAGILETLALAWGLNEGLSLPTAGFGDPDPDAPARLCRVAERSEAQVALKASLAFGGLNAALALVPASGAPRDVVAVGEPRIASRSSSSSVGVGDLTLGADALAARLGVRVERVARLDPLCLAVVAALDDLATQVGRARVAGAALVVAHDVATVATNALFWARIVARGPRWAEPRRFPYTSPNACVGEAALLFGMRGPTLAVGGAPGLLAQGRSVADDLLLAGMARDVVVVEASESSAAGRALTAAYGAPPPETRAVATLVSLS